jgi:hypothetical protein
MAIVTINEVVEALTCNRTEFSNLFAEAQIRAKVPFARQKTFESIATALPNDKEAFTKALEEAEREGYFESLVELATTKDLEKGKVATLVIKRSGNASLQAIVDTQAGLTDPILYSRNINKSSQYIGKISIDWAAKGTGMLIGPNLILTAWHVVKDMFEKGKNAQGQDVYIPKQNPPAFEVEFNNFLDLVSGVTRPMNIIKVGAHKNWYVIHSAADESELDETRDDLKLKEGLWDYAIIRLASPVGLERRFHIPNGNVNEPEISATIVLFQHPQGVPLKMDENKIIAWATVDNAGEKKLRFLHSLNTTYGSSGGPCFDKKTFSLVGIHQGAWPVKVEGKTANRGIFIKNIVSSYTEEFKNGLPQPDPSDTPVWRLTNQMSFQPVIGCDAFQAELWKSAITGEKRILFIKGDPATGKTFHVDLATYLLGDADHFKVLLEGKEISGKNAVEVVNYICACAGATVPLIVPFKDYNTAPGGWLKDEVAPKLINALSTRRDNRLVWVCIKELNKHKVDGEHAFDLLNLLYLAVRDNAWLRIILDGQSNPLPNGLDLTVVEYPTQRFTVADIDQFLKRASAELNKDSSSLVPAKMLHRVYIDELTAAGGQPIVKLISYIRDYLELI